MSTQMHRRIQKIEAEVIGKDKTVSTKVLYAPEESADIDSMKIHDRELDEARLSHEKVIVVSAQHTQRQQGARGVVYVPTELEASLELAASQPSRRGNLDGLADILDSLSGQIVGVVATPLMP